MEKKKLSPINPALIKELKEQYGTIFSYKTADGRELIFRTPTIVEMDASASMSNKPLAANRLLAKTCALAGDESIIEDPAAFIGLSGKLTGIVKRVEGELSEL